MSLRTEIVQIRQLPAGSRIGYRSKEKTQKDLTIGTIPIGYNHGLDRKIFKGGYVLVHSQKVPFIGAISMNSSTIDITGIDDMEIGDEVIIIGRQGDPEININELALKSGTIAGELMMRFGKSIPRDYQLDGEDITSEIVLEQEKTDDIHIQYFQTENELPEWINVLDIVNFLYSNLAPCGDPKDVVYKVIDYALSTHPGGKGFILLASVEKKIIGAAVCIQSDKVDRTPENRIVYVGVNKDYRTNGLGTRLIREAMDIVNGDVKVIMKKDNPAVNLFKKLGFSDEYIELSHQKKD